MKAIAKSVSAGAAALFLGAALPSTAEAELLESGQLNPGQHATYTVRLTEGERPFFFVLADPDAIDVDLVVKFPDGTVVVDDFVDPNPRLRVVAPVSGDYLVNVVVHETDGGIWTAYELHRLD